MQKALHAILEAIFEPKFLNSSHGFRPKKSVHSALLRVYLNGHRHNWVIQGDITQCFDQIPHHIIRKRINKFIGDPRFLLILNKFLKAGFIEPKTGEIVIPEIGSTQAGVLSPLLCNIVLQELDKYMADTENKFSKGKTRKINPVDKSLANKRFSSNDSVERLNLLSEMRKTRRSLMAEPNYRRLDYIRYAEDFIVLVSGSFKDAKFIQNNIKDYIKANCGLELNQNKTVISNILKDEWSFLGAKMKKLKINPELLPTLLGTGPNPTIACALREKGPNLAWELRAKGKKLRFCILICLCLGRHLLPPLPSLLSFTLAFA